MGVVAPPQSHQDTWEHQTEIGRAVLSSKVEPDFVDRLIWGVLTLKTAIFDQFRRSITDNRTLSGLTGICQMTGQLKIFKIWIKGIIGDEYSNWVPLILSKRFLQFPK